MEHTLSYLIEEDISIKCTSHKQALEVCKILGDIICNWDEENTILDPSTCEFFTNVAETIIYPASKFIRLYNESKDAPPQTKGQIIGAFTVEMSKAILSIFYACGLDSYIETIIRNEPTNEEFLFSFKKVVNGSVVSGNDLAKGISRDFANWLLKGHAFPCGQIWHVSVDENFVEADLDKLWDEFLKQR